MSVLTPEHDGTNTLQVLIVQDDESELAFTKRALRGFPELQFQEARDGEIARQLLEQGLRPDLVILDLGLPKIDGLQLLDWMRSRGETRETRVLLTTGTRDPERIRRAEALGITGVVDDAYDLNEWAANLNEHVRRILHQPLASE